MSSSDEDPEYDKIPYEWQGIVYVPSLVMFAVPFGQVWTAHRTCGACRTTIVLIIGLVVLFSNKVKTEFAMVCFRDRYFSDGYNAVRVLCHACLSGKGRTCHRCGAQCTQVSLIYPLVRLLSFSANLLAEQRCKWVEGRTQHG